MEDQFKRRPNELALSRVKTIMKSSPDVENVSQESVYLVTKATELFIKYMVEESYYASGNAKTLEYRHVSEVVQTKEKLGFLREIVPRKCTLREIQEQLSEKCGNKYRFPGVSSSSSDLSMDSEDESTDQSSSQVEETSESNSSPKLIKQKHGKQMTSATMNSTLQGNSQWPDSEHSRTLIQDPTGKYAYTITPEPGSPFTIEGIPGIMLPGTIEMSYEAPETSVSRVAPSSPMSVVSISSDSRTPSPSPSYSSLSPESHLDVHQQDEGEVVIVVDADSDESSSGCEYVED